MNQSQILLMKYLLNVISPIVALVVTISCVSNTAANNSIKETKKQSTTEQNEGKFQPIAVIELFTSQGCSSCPPADKLLTKTIVDNREKNIYALSFHVDYWDRLGWKDPFSDQSFSQRQYDYVKQMELNSAYTPQMVVNGKREFVGSNGNNLKAALVKALNSNTTASITNITAVKKENNWEVKYELDGDFNNKQLNVALVSEQEITEIKRGENSGRTLQNNNVVRRFTSENAMKNGDIVLEQAVATGSRKQVIIVYLQDKTTLSITAASKVNL